MKRIFKCLLSLVLNCIGVIEWFLKCLFLCCFTIGKRKSSRLNPVAIVANGPTLMDELEKIKTDITMDYCMLNHSAKTDLFWRLKPKYYVMIDPLFFSKILVEINNPYMDAFMKVDWNMTIFVPIRNLKNMKNMVSENQNIKVETTPASLSQMINSNKLRNYFFRNKMATPIQQNVVVGAIYAMIMEGFERINLLGVGHSWLNAMVVNEKNEVCLKDMHYYNKEAELKPWYTVNGEPYKMHVILRDLAQMFDSYHQLRCFADSLGDVRIVNYTKDSYIDAFERIR